MEPSWSHCGTIHPEVFLDQLSATMAIMKAMKAMGACKVSGKPMTKGDIQEYIAEATELKASDARKMDVQRIGCGG